MKKQTEQLLILIALQHGEISEGKAVDLLGKDRDWIRDEMKKRCGTWRPYSELMEAVEHCQKTLNSIKDMAQRQLGPRNSDKDFG